MPYFMVTIHGEDDGGWGQVFEVQANTAAAAVVRAVAEVKGTILHGIHIGVACAEPTSDEVMASWPPDDHFERLAVSPLVDPSGRDDLGEVRLAQLKYASAPPEE
jgi:hypothetical protein